MNSSLLLTGLLARLELVARYVAGLSGWRRMALAFASGALSVLALPPVDILPVLFVTLPLLVWLTDGAGKEEQRHHPSWPVLRSAASAGWWFGFGYFLLGLYWIGFAFMVEAERFAIFMPLAVIILPAGLSLFTAAALALARYFWLPGYRRIVVLALSFTLLEWLRGHILTGFPWNLIGESFTSSDALMQWAAIIGAHGLSFAAMLIFAAPATFDPRMDRLPQTSDRVRALRRIWLIPVTALGVLALLWAGGAVRLLLAEAPGSVAQNNVMLRIVQPNIPQADKWKADNQMARIGELLRLSSEPSALQPGGLTARSIVVWPESALPMLLAREPYILAAVSRILPKGALLMTGSIRGEPSVDGRQDRLTHFYNSLYAVNADGAIVGTYDKFHLVPFGEYLPLKDWLSRIGLRQLVQLQGSFDTGPGPVTMPLPGMPDVSPLICYEIIFPGNVVDAAMRPRWIVNVTNDAWFGTSSGPYQHLAQARLRAVEEGVPIARAANTGVSAVIDPYGRVIAEKALNTGGSIDAPLPPALSATPYARFGDSLPALMMLVAGLALFVVRRR